LSAVALNGKSVLLINVDLPEPDTPVTQVKRPIGDLQVDIAQVVATGTLEG